MDHNWVEDQMHELGIPRNDLIEDTTLDKASISLLLSYKKKMNKSVKAAFFYYFAYKILKKAHYTSSETIYKKNIDKLH